MIFLHFVVFSVEIFALWVSPKWHVTKGFFPDKTDFIFWLFWWGQGRITGDEYYLLNLQKMCIVVEGEVSLIFFYHKEKYMVMIKFFIRSLFIKHFLMLFQNPHSFLPFVFLLFSPLCCTPVPQKHFYSMSRTTMRNLYFINYMYKHETIPKNI